ncbi:protein-L-isoaspartate O-methyltransferase [Candidatus Bipolaricaulota bacterium]
MLSATKYRTEFVNALAKAGVFRSERVRQAFLNVRRHQFIHHWFMLGTSTGVPAWSPVLLDSDHPSREHLQMIYSDQSLVTAVNGILPVGSLSQPSLVARMLDELRTEESLRILEIGTCSGYNAALLSELVSETGIVVTIENRPEAAEDARETLSGEGYENVTVLCGDGFFGAPEHQPFDRLIATAGCSDISPHWLDQLRGGGTILIPLQHGQADYLLRVSPDEDHPDCASGRAVGCAAFMSIEGIMAWANPWRCLIPPTEPDVEFQRKALPSCLPECEKGTSPLKEVRHSDFHFFLTLVCHELWHTTRSYGLADLSTGAKATISRDGIITSGPPARAAQEAADRLVEKLTGIIKQWEGLGSPQACDFRIRFVPKHLFHSPPFTLADTKWIIERVSHVEMVSL